MVEDTKTSKPQWTDRTRNMVTLSRGAPARIRHLAKDLQCFLPHIVSEPKFDKKDTLLALNEMANLARCQRVMYFETRSGHDLYLWLSTSITDGPSAKFRVLNVHTMNELNFTGNCLMYSRNILSFDSAFDSEPHLQLLREILSKAFYTPENHPKSKPYFDHVINFGLTPDKRIWIRFYAVTPGKVDSEPEEIGPRFVLELVRILNGSFEGEVLYNNPTYISPRFQRRQIRLAAAAKTKARAEERLCKVVKASVIKKIARPDPVGEIFNEEVESKEAKKLMAQIDKKKKKSGTKTSTKATGTKKTAAAVNGTKKAASVDGPPAKKAKK